MANKFGNQAAAVFGISFKSGAERDHALWLQSEKQARRITSWQYEKSYDLLAFDDVSGSSSGGKVLIGKHKPDFTVELANGTTEVHEIKGGRATKTEAWELRRKIFKANYPHIRYKVFDGLVRVHGGRVIQFD